MRNFVSICLEDTSPRLGCHGNAAARTPHLDRLAGEGCVYTHAFSTAPVCSPARAAAATGMYPTFLGAQHMRVTHTNPFVPQLRPYTCVPPAYVKFFSETLRAHGLYCTTYGKSDTQFELDIMQAPFTAWDKQGEDQYPAPWRQRPAGTFFFSAFNLGETHESRMWAEQPEPVRTDPGRVSLPPYLPDTLENRLALARAHDRLEEADARVGTILSALEEDHLASDTIVIVWSDHGEGLPRSKRWLYDTGIRVPLIVRWPGNIAPGSSDTRLVSTMDIAPTVLSLAGVPIPVHYQGMPFLGNRALTRETVFAARDRHDEGHDMVRAVRDARFKYIRNYHPDLTGTVWTPYAFRHPIQRGLDSCWADAEGGNGPRGAQLSMDRRRPEELYDCESDPWEMCNLVDDAEYADTLCRLRTAMDEWQRDADPYRDIDEATLISSMWPTGKRPQTCAPMLIAHGQHHDGQIPLASGDTLTGPVYLRWYSATPGASTDYRLDSADDWHLAGPLLRMPVGEHTISARSVRMGYAPSEMVTWEFIVE